MPIERDQTQQTQNPDPNSAPLDFSFHGMVGRDIERENGGGGPTRAPPSHLISRSTRSPLYSFSLDAAAYNLGLVARYCTDEFNSFVSHSSTPLCTAVLPPVFKGCGVHLRKSRVRIVVVVFGGVRCNCTRELHDG